MADLYHDNKVLVVEEEIEEGEVYEFDAAASKSVDGLTGVVTKGSKAKVASSKLWSSLRVNRKASSSSVPVTTPQFDDKSATTVGTHQPRPSLFPRKQQKASMLKSIQVDISSFSAIA